MAAVKSNEKTSLILKVETGQSAGGAAIYSNRTFSKVRPSVSDSDLLTFATSLGNLQQYPLGSVLRRDEATLIEE